MSSSFLKKQWVIATIVVGILFISLVTLEVVGTNPNDPYCQSIDPTGCIVGVKIVNDTSNEYIIKQCNDAKAYIKCQSTEYTAALFPGQSQEANGSTEADEPQPWNVIDKHNKLVGCLNLQFTKYHPNPIILRLSKMSVCR